MFNIVRTSALIILIGTLGVGTAAGPNSRAAESEGRFEPLIPLNLSELDFPVPWGFRHGRPARVFFTFTVGDDGGPVDVETLKTIPHNDYVGIAKTTLKKFRYADGDNGKQGFEELDYCIMTDGQSTFACKIRFERLSGDPDKKANVPGDVGFFEIDKYGGFPRVKSYVLPDFPWLAAKKSQCGWVKVAFDVSKAGIPGNLEILETSEGGVFSLSLKRALKTFTFEKGDRPNRLVYLISFEIPGKCQA